MAWVGAVVPGGLHAGSIWPHDTEGLSPRNQEVLAAAAAALGRLRGPWVLAGDRNMNPDELEASGWLDIVQGVIVACSHECRFTCLRLHYVYISS